ncbi:acyltransferase family protein [Mammaliicoccus sciuri]|uniref:acyltransferase family protein n=1 Tax=Mammaliicoccus sciuri TaxID=1296 RepID=UPI0034DD3BF1
MANEKERDHYFDNARFFLIVLVVFGHLTRSYVNESHIFKALYMFIYSFHMPAFVLISGFFAKGVGKPGYIKKITIKLLLPYLIFQLFYGLYYYYIDKDDTLNISPFDPQWAMWFLVSLFSWHIILHFVRNFNPYITFTVAILLGLVVGYFDFINAKLSLSRTFVFFPIFLLGYYINKEQSFILRNKKHMWLSSISLIVIFIAYLLTDYNFEWLFGSKPYSALEGDVDVYSAFKRLFIYVVIFVSTFSFLNLIPERKLPLTYIGSRTMFIYLLHGLFVGLFRSKEWDQMLLDQPYVWVAIILITIAIVYFFSSDIVRHYANPVVNIKKPPKKKK